jgi:hypothetical protein
MHAGATPTARRASPGETPVNVRPGRSVPALTLALLTATLLPRAAAAQTLLDGPLTLSSATLPDLRVLALAAQEPGPSLDFDLLGEAPTPAAPKEDPALKTRRKMLNLHQGLGIGLLALQVAVTVTGQLNYNDKFTVGENTDKYKLTHKVLSYVDVAAFAAVGGIALFAPRDKNAPPGGFGRSTVHKISMAVAAVGMATQVVLGVYTVNREGFVDQQQFARAHLAVGYATLAAMLVGVGALVL